MSKNILGKSVNITLTETDLNLNANYNSLLTQNFTASNDIQLGLIGSLTTK